jgi:hypothetical protein
VTGAPDSIKIDILRWSTDAEREKLLSAWNKTGEPTGASGRAGGRSGGRGGRGGRGAEPAEEAVPAGPEASLGNALQEAPTVGYLWSSAEVAGYALRYAAKLNSANGLERILLITNRRLGALNDLWKPAGQAQPNMYAFSVIELHVNAKGEGEGKASLSGKVAPDDTTKMIALESYDALPVMLRNVKSRATTSH